MAQSVQVVAAVATGAACGAIGFEESSSFVESQSLGAHSDQVRSDRDAEYAKICRGGRRSRLASGAVGRRPGRVLGRQVSRSHRGLSSKTEWNGSCCSLTHVVEQIYIHHNRSELVVGTLNKDRSASRGCDTDAHRPVP